jgi:hypothetical protein
MRHSLVILIGVVAVGATVFAGSFFVCRQICGRQMANPADDLTWLSSQFQLNAEAMSHIRDLHQGYLPKCADMCARIAAKKIELESLIAGSTNGDPVVEKKLIELGELRARCQAQMLEHFVAVSQAMPPEQGRRYLAQMQRLALGFHEQKAQTVSDHAGHEHQH